MRCLAEGQREHSMEVILRQTSRARDFFQRQRAVECAMHVLPAAFEATVNLQTRGRLDRWDAAYRAVGFFVQREQVASQLHKLLADPQRRSVDLRCPIDSPHSR